MWGRVEERSGLWCTNLSLFFPSLLPSFFLHLFFPLFLFLASFLLPSLLIFFFPPFFPSPSPPSLLLHFLNPYSKAGTGPGTVEDAKMKKDEFLGPTNVGQKQMKPSLQDSKMA